MIKPKVTAAGQLLRTTRSPFSYLLRAHKKFRSMVFTKRLSSFSCFKKREAIIGDSVNATTADTATAPASVNANSENSAPVRPPWKPMGTYTAISTTEIAMIGPANSRAPCSDA